MADSRVEIDPAWIEAEAADWTSGIGATVADVTERVHAAAVAMAPVSARGSRYARPGYLKSRVAVSTSHHDDSGVVVGLVGIPLKAGSRYPLPFIANPRGSTRDANAHGKYGYRAAANYFIRRALAAVAGG